MVAYFNTDATKKATNVLRFIIIGGICFKNIEHVFIGLLKISELPPANGNPELSVHSRKTRRCRLEKNEKSQSLYFYLRLHKFRLKLRLERCFNVRSIFSRPCTLFYTYVDMVLIEILLCTRLCFLKNQVLHKLCTQNTCQLIPFHSGSR